MFESIVEEGRKEDGCQSPQATPAPSGRPVLRGSKVRDARQGGRATESKGSGGRVSRQKMNWTKSKERHGESHRWVALCGVFPGRMMVGPPAHTLGAWSDNERCRY